MEPLSRPSQRYIPQGNKNTTFVIVFACQYVFTQEMRTYHLLIYWFTLSGNAFSSYFGPVKYIILFSCCLWRNRFINSITSKKESKKVARCLSTSLYHTFSQLCMRNNFRVIVVPLSPPFMCPVWIDSYPCSCLHGSSQHRPAAAAEWSLIGCQQHCEWWEIKT